MAAQIQAMQPQAPQDSETIADMKRLGFPISPEGFAAYKSAGDAPQTASRTAESTVGKLWADYHAAVARGDTEEAESLRAAIELENAPKVADDESDFDKPLSTSDLESYRLPDGSKLPAGSTLRDAMDNGALPYTATELTQQRAAESGVATLEMLEDIALGDGGVFIDAGGGPVTDTWPGRFTRGMANATGTFFGTEASRQRDLYTRLREAYIATLARSRGESGSLSDSDIARISQALPELGAVPMTEKQARAMFEEARKIYGSSNQSRPGQPSDPIEYDFDPKTRRTVPRR
jgi:hypothetical protein